MCLTSCFYISCRIWHIPFFTLLYSMNHTWFNLSAIDGLLDYVYLPFLQIMLQWLTLRSYCRRGYICGTDIFKSLLGQDVHPCNFDSCRAEPLCIKVVSGYAPLAEWERPVRTDLEAHCDQWYPGLSFLTAPSSLFSFWTHPAFLASSPGALCLGEKQGSGWWEGRRWVLHTFSPCPTLHSQLENRVSSQGNTYLVSTPVLSHVQGEGWSLRSADAIISWSCSQLDL